MKNNNTLTYRVTQVEKEVKSIDNKVDLLLTNHLPHINESIVAMKTRMNVLTVVNIGGIIIGLIVSKYL